MVRHKHPDSAFIDALGSDTIVQRFKLTPQRLYAWRIRGIPDGFRAALAQMALIAAVEIPAGFLQPGARQRAAEADSRDAAAIHGQAVSAEACA